MKWSLYNENFYFRLPEMHETKFFIKDIQRSERTFDMNNSCPVTSSQYNFTKFTSNGLFVKTICYSDKSIFYSLNKTNWEFIEIYPEGAFTNLKLDEVKYTFDQEIDYPLDFPIDHCYNYIEVEFITDAYDTSYRSKNSMRKEKLERIKRNMNNRKD